MKKILLIFFAFPIIASCQDAVWNLQEDESEIFYPESKVALVIGNTNYKHHDYKLENPINDAKLMKKTFKELGFRVIFQLDLDLDSMEIIFSEFKNLIEDYDFGIIYFAGHGIQNNNGSSLLLPIDFSPQYVKESTQEKHSISSFKLVQNLVINPNNKILFILDACRTKHNIGNTRINIEPETLKLCLSTRSGKPAFDHEEYNNTIYTFALSVGLRKDLPLETILRRTENWVRLNTKYLQSPIHWHGEYLDNIILKPKNN